MQGGVFTYERRGDTACFFYKPAGSSTIQCTGSDIKVKIYAAEPLPAVPAVPASPTTLEIPAVPAQGTADARDIRAEHADTPLYERICGTREFYRIKKSEATWNTQLDPVHLWALQNGVELSVPASKLSVVSLDIECISPTGAFPDSARDPILTLSVCGESRRWVLSLNFGGGRFGR